MVLLVQEKQKFILKLIKDFLKKKQVLVMLPEIALSEQWLNRFKKALVFIHWFGIQK